MLELKNRLLTLKKESISVNEYTNAFSSKMRFTLRVVSDELEKIDRYANGLPWECSMSVK